MSHYEKGEYVGKVIGHAFDEIGAKATPGLRIQFEVIACRDPSDPDGWVEVEESFERELVAWFSEKSAKRSIEDIVKFAGWKGKDVGELDGDVLVGNHIRVDCAGDRDGYDDFRFPGGGGGKLKPLEKKNGLGKKMRNLYNGLLGSSSGGSKSKTKVEKPVDDDDEIPF